jgi:hypothetical protein
MVKEGLDSLVQSSRPGKAWAEEKGRRRRRGRLERRRRAVAAAAAVAGEKEGEDVGLRGGVDAGFAAIDDGCC